MQFGAAIWPFQWYPPYEDAIRRLARLGFRQVELIAWDRETLRTYYTTDRIAALRQLIADEGLVLSEFVTTPAGSPVAILPVARPGSSISVRRSKSPMRWARL